MAATKSDESAEAINNLAKAVQSGLSRLGIAEASTPFGAIEGHAVTMKKAAEDIKDGLFAIAEAIDGLTEAIKSRP